MNLGVIYKGNENFKMAEECYIESMEKFQKNYDNNKQDIVKLYYNLGNLYQVTN